MKQASGKARIESGNGRSRPQGPHPFRHAGADRRVLPAALLAALGALALPRAAAAPALTTLYTFTNGTDGASPKAALTLGADGNFYGTSSGNVADAGSIFRITPAGAFTSLMSFGSNGGGGPQGPMLQGPDGTFYGTTFYTGGSGSIFTITPAGSFSTFYQFGATQGDGRYPADSIARDAAGNLYGITTGGGGGPYGTVYKVTAGGNESLFHVFTNGADGSYPYGGLHWGSDGNLYGTTSDGGNMYAGGTLFRVTPAGDFTTLYSFGTGSDASNPLGGVVQGGDGNLYGTSAAGGAHSSGAVFKVTPAGVETVLYSFTGGADGFGPQPGLLLAGDGNFYGVTEYAAAPASGTVFRITPSGTLTTLYSFTGGADGNMPNALTDGGDGFVYGTTFSGGSANQYGTVFKLGPVVGPPPPAGLAAAAGNGQAALSWSASTGAASYSVYQADAAGAEGATPVLSGLTATQATVSGLNNGSTYYFTVEAVDAAGNSSAPSNEAAATPQAPALLAPTNLVATAGNASVSLSWTGAPLAASYNVYAGGSPGGEAATPVLSNVAGTTATVSGLSNGSAYYFTVAAN
jgi:uncharacterized repeat protein (TIGR03803 family)